jgi:hypothetical protein
MRRESVLSCHDRATLSPIPCRPRRKFPSPARTDDGAPSSSPTGRSTPSLKEAEDAAIRDVVALQEEIGFHQRHRRRVPPHVVAHGLHLPAGRHHPHREQLQVAFKNAEGTTSFTSAALKVNDKVEIDDTIFADAFKFLSPPSRRPCPN